MFINSSKCPDLKTSLSLAIFFLASLNLIFENGFSFINLCPIELDIFLTPGSPDNYLFGISPEGIGTIGMFINFIIAIVVSRLTKPTPEIIKELVENIRYPK